MYYYNRALNTFRGVPEFFHQQHQMMQITQDINIIPWTCDVFVSKVFVAIQEISTEEWKVFHLFSATKDNGSKFVDAINDKIWCVIKAEMIVSIVIKLDLA